MHSSPAARRKLFQQSPTEHPVILPPNTPHPPPGFSHPQTQQRTPSRGSASPSTAQKYDTQSPLPASRLQSSSSQPERFGLLGLVNLMKADNVDLNHVALGTDLMQLGLNLSTLDPLFAKFDSPFDVNHQKDISTSDIYYDLPACYYSKPPSLQPKHFERFPLETLFFIFYAHPQDVLQCLASDALVSRQWKFHKKLSVWLKQNPYNKNWMLWDCDSWTTETNVDLIIEEKDLFDELILTQS
ncbi:hypothetical protein RCL1_005592 [Eukaryota sp. TZLM3-RCL]